MLKARLGVTPYPTMDEAIAGAVAVTAARAAAAEGGT